MRNDTPLDFVSSTSNFSISYAGGVKIPTGAAAMATPDCFLYAKAALPQRNGVSDASLRKSPAPAAFSSRMYSAADGSGALVSDSDPPSPLRSPSADRKRSSEPAAELDDVLVIQQSVLSQPLGREVDELKTSLLHQDGLLKRSSPDHQPIEEKEALLRPATVPTTTIYASITIDGVTPPSSSSPASAITPPVASPRKLQASRTSQQGSVSTSSHFLLLPVLPRPESTRGR